MEFKIEVLIQITEVLFAQLDLHDKVVCLWIHIIIRQLEWIV